MQQVELKNGVKLYPFSSFEELVDVVSHEKKMLVAVNAEKILLNTNIINKNSASNYSAENG